MKVVIMNAVFGNTGDVAIQQALVRHLKEALGEDIQITIAENQHGMMAPYYPEYTFAPILSSVVLGKSRPGPLRLLWGLFRFSWWYLSLPRIAMATYLLAAGRRTLGNALLTRNERKAMAPLLDADLLVSTGGTYLVETYRLETRMLDFNVALRLGKPLVLYTQSMGPFTRPKYKRQLRRLFKHTRLILLRDERSANHLHALCGTLPQAHVLADAAFSLADDARLDVGDASQWYVAPKDEAFQVGISVRNWPFIEGDYDAGMQEYREAVRQLVIHLVNERGASVTFLSTCQGVPGYVYDDAAEAERIIAGLPEATRAHVQLDSDFHAPDALMERLASLDLMVATRMHAAILALSAGVPVLPIAYEFKTKALFERMGLGDVVADMNHVASNELVENLHKLEHHPVITSQQLFNEVRAQRETANRARNLLAEVGKAVVDRTGAAHG